MLRSPLSSPLFVAFTAGEEAGHATARDDEFSYEMRDMSVKVGWEKDVAQKQIPNAEQLVKRRGTMRW